MDVVAKVPAMPGGEEVPVLSLDNDLNELPKDHTAGISEGPDADWLTQVGVVRLAKAVLAVADSFGLVARADGEHTA